MPGGDQLWFIPTVVRGSLGREERKVPLRPVVTLRRRRPLRNRAALLLPPRLLGVARSCDGDCVLGSRRGADTADDIPTVASRREREHIRVIVHECIELWQRRAEMRWGDKLLEKTEESRPRIRSYSYFSVRFHRRRNGNAYVPLVSYAHNSCSARAAVACARSGPHPSCCCALAHH